jgi:putative hydrolase
MIDFHTHSLFSDGELVPAELVRRARVIGYKAIGITDHADGSNLDFIIPRIVKVAAELNRFQETIVIPGIELTHVPPDQIQDLVREARSLGAQIVVIHGETLVEPVAPGTNRAGIEAGANIIAHPGLISEEEVRLAAGRGVFLEITARRGHSLTNGHVAALAKKHGARLVIDTDSHSPRDLITRDFALKVLKGAGLTELECDTVLQNSEDFLKSLTSKDGFPFARG